MGAGASGGNWDFGFQELTLNAMVQPGTSEGSITSGSGSAGAPGSRSSSTPGSYQTTGSSSLGTEIRKPRQGSSDREYVSAAALGTSAGRQSVLGDRGDAGSIMTKGSGSGSKSSDGRSGLTGSSSAKELGKVKPKAKAWEAPVYAEFSFG